MSRTLKVNAALMASDMHEIVEIMREMNFYHTKTRYVDFLEQVKEESTEYYSDYDEFVVIVLLVISLLSFIHSFTSSHPNLTHTFKYTYTHSLFSNGRHYRYRTRYDIEEVTDKAKRMALRDWRNRHPSAPLSSIPPRCR